MKEGVPIDFIDPQPAVRKHAETSSDWEFSTEAQYLYEMAGLIKSRLIDPVLLTERESMPDPVISFEDMRNYNTLAAYRLIRNPQGLNYVITMNTQHYVVKKEDDKEVLQWEFGKWAQLETLAHEQVHLWQQTCGKDPIVPGKVYHNKEFVEKCESIGLHPKLGEGYHLELATEPFSILMNELGIEPPKELAKGLPELDIDWFKWLQDFKGKGRKGRSTLSKWSCGCQNARIGRKEFHAKCTCPDCGNIFVRSD